MIFLRINKMQYLLTFTPAPFASSSRNSPTAGELAFRHIPVAANPKARIRKNRVRACWVYVTVLS